LRLVGELDVVALGAAVGDVVGRHESVRTVFPVVEGVPWQRVLGVEVAWPGGLRVVGAGAGGVAGCVAALVGRGFDLVCEVPLRVVLLEVGEREHVLVVVVHHIAFDGWSVGPFVRDLSVAYGARSAGGVPVWEELPVQYGDFTLWQREVLESDGFESRELGFWREVLR
ncbi:condensation domain-containing protein, partial [Streptomyces sp. MMG1121]|uniref:condensation domain-containing protein n=1 Tax=Streptomyces sp. MMG1121 TaxID=1415544 RepID=UPI0006C1C4A1